MTYESGLWVEAVRHTGKTAEKQLHEFVLDHCVDPSVLHYLLPSQRPNAWESSLWDYKREFPDNSGRGSEDDDHHHAELIKDVVSFHNAFGGYLLAGVVENDPEPLVGCTNVENHSFTVEKLNEKLLHYTRSRIMCRFNKIPVSSDRGQVTLGLLHVPMRDPGSPVVKMLRGAPDRRKGKPAFKVNDIYVRIGDQSRPVNQDVQGLQFACSPRPFAEAERRSTVSHNLPIPDPNLIRFIGRTNYLLQLWTWLTERHTPVKVLTALGGTGKTAIANEFARQVVECPPAWLSKVVWLTAKKQTFAAVRDAYVKVTRTDFDDVEGFLKALILEIGGLPSDVEGAVTQEELLDVAVENLGLFPALIVIDDVDSLDQDSQAELFGVVSSLVARCFNGGTRALLTSRLELGAGASQLIQVGGFEEPEFREYAKMVAEERGIEMPEAVVVRLFKESKGSPIFCSSIIRLASLGVDIHKAITRWKGEEGEAVRKFAFERELKDLSDSAARTLYALMMLSETTQLELAQVLQTTGDLITRDLAKIREYHMFASQGDPSTGARLSVPEPIRLMASVLRPRLTDPSRIERECARVQKAVPKVEEKTAAAIRDVVALWKADDYPAALIVAQASRKAHPKSADIHCILGQAYLKVTPPKPEEADKAFRQAWQIQSRRPELVPNWLKAKALLKDWAGIVELTNAIDPPSIRGYAVVLQVEALVNLAVYAQGREDAPRAIHYLRTALATASRAIEQRRAGDEISALRDLCRTTARAYVQAVRSYNARPDDRINVFNAVMDAFESHITETWIIDIAVESLVEWSEAVARRPFNDAEALDILQNRLKDLRRVLEHVRAEAHRPELVQRIEQALAKLEQKFDLDQA